MAVFAGQYRDRIKIMRINKDKLSPFGTLAEDSIEQYAFPWCRVMKTEQSETTNLQDRSVTILYLEVRYSKMLENPTSDMFVIFRGNEYDINSVENVLQLNERLVIKCTKRGGD